jgi:hypothetical protein
VFDKDETIGAELLVTSILGSRKVISWALADRLEASLAVEALNMALAASRPAPVSSTTPTVACNTPAMNTANGWRPTGSDQHEPARKPLPQPQGRALHTNPEAGGSEHEDLRHNRGSQSRRRRRLHRKHLQQRPTAFRARHSPQSSSTPDLARFRKHLKDKDTRMQWSQSNRRSPPPSHPILNAQGQHPWRRYSQLKRFHFRICFPVAKSPGSLVGGPEWEI